MRGRYFVVLASLLAVAGSGCNRQAEAANADATDRTEAALLDQLKCQKDPQVALAINAMIANGLIKYVGDESGVYAFEPVKPLKLFGLKVVSVSGFDYTAFKDVPGSKMVGTAPPVFIQIDVAASASELRKRALNAGLIEATKRFEKRGFEITSEGTYLAPKRSGSTAGIACSRLVAMAR